MTEYLVTYNKTGEDVSTFSSWESDTDVNLTAASTKVYSHGGVTGTLGNGDAMQVQGSPGITATVASITATQVLLVSIAGGTISSSDVLEKIGATGNNITVSDNGDSASAVLEVYDDDGNITGEYWQMSGATASATNKRIVRNATGDNPLLDRQNTQDAFHAIDAAEHYCQIIGIEVKNWKASSSTNYIGERAVHTGSGNQILIDKCIAHVDTPSATFYYRGFSGSGSNPNTNYGQFQNCICFGLKGAAVGTAFRVTQGGSGTGKNKQKAFNCTAYDCEIGFQNSGGSIGVSVNNISYDNTLNWSGTFFATDSGYNLSDNDGSSTAPGSNNVVTTQTKNQLFTDPDNDDFSLPAGSDAVGQGRDLSGVLTFGESFNYDIDGTTRTVPWSIGAYHSDSECCFDNSINRGINRGILKGVN